MDALSLQSAAASGLLAGRGSLVKGRRYVEESRCEVS